MGVRVALVTKDETLVMFCRETLCELFGTEWTLVTSVSGSASASGQPCLWDFTPGETALPEDLEPAKLCKPWFLLHRKDLPALQGVLGTTHLNVLIKPMTRAALRTILAGASDQGDEQKIDSSESIDAIRVERDTMLQFLIQANLRVQESNQERDNFLARSVHDFRAPLTAICGYCSLLLEEELGPVTPEQRKVLERMVQSATRLSRISNGMFVTVPQNDQPLNLDKTDIRDCLAQALHDVTPVVDGKRITLKAEFEAVPDNLLFDQSQIEQTLLNLLDNACRFTPREGLIELRGYPFFWERRSIQGSRLDPALERRVKQRAVFNSFRIDIRDSGPGIPAEHVHRIFEECTSYGGGQDRSGGGLGLAICRMILRRHQGRIWAESHPAGAIFSFVLPLQNAAVRFPKIENPNEAGCLAGTVEE